MLFYPLNNSFRFFLFRSVFFFEIFISQTCSNSARVIFSVLFGFQISIPQRNSKVRSNFCQRFDSVNLLKICSFVFRNWLKFHVNICQIPILINLNFSRNFGFGTDFSALNPTRYIITFITNIP